MEGIIFYETKLRFSIEPAIKDNTATNLQPFHVWKPGKTLSSQLIVELVSHIYIARVTVITKIKKNLCYHHKLSHVFLRDGCGSLEGIKNVAIVIYPVGIIY